MCIDVSNVSMVILFWFGLFEIVPNLELFVLLWQEKKKCAIPWECLPCSRKRDLCGTLYFLFAWAALLQSKTFHLPKTVLLEKTPSNEEKICWVPHWTAQSSFNFIYTRFYGHSNSAKAPNTDFFFFFFNEKQWNFWHNSQQFILRKVVSSHLEQKQFGMV